MKTQDIKPFAWGAAIGGIGLSIVMFATGWAVTSSSAERNARMVSQTAVTESLAKICVAQYQVTANKGAKLEALKQLTSWDQGEFVIKQGWATMPGSDAGTGEVARACAALLTAARG